MSALDSIPPTLFTRSELSTFYEFFYRHTGILFTQRKDYFVERRLLQRMGALGQQSFQDYFNHMRFQRSGEEFQALVNLMTVNETYFFREAYQLEALVNGLLPEISTRRQKGRSISLWSIPCSTGEEPYSIALYILEGWRQANDYNIKIHASDIDTRVLTEARRGIYSERSLQRLGPTLRQRYFQKNGPDTFRIREELRISIDFTVMNLSNPLHVTRYRNIDVIFCRNLLIYFDDQSRQKAIDALYDCLAPGGFLCLGSSESMSRMWSLFVPRSFGNTIVYQKPLKEA